MEKSTTNSIPLTIAQEMKREFIKSQGETKDYTKSVWFPIDQIDNIYSRLKAEDANGLRIYFGRYTEEIIQELNKNISDAKDHIPSNYKNRNTVIFVSTEKNTNNPETGSDYFKELHSILPENKGVLCPPHTGCDVDSPMFI